MKELLEIFSLDIPAYLQGPALMAALAGLGLFIGILTGLFGVGGGFLINPLLIVLMGLPETLVVGSSLSFTIGTGTAGAASHWRLKNVDLKTAMYLIGGALGGCVLGVLVHLDLKQVFGPAKFRMVFLTLYLVMLLVTAWVVARGPGRHKSGKPLVQRMRLGPHTDLPAAGLVHVSVPGLILVGFVIGLLKGLLGIGGGVLFMPLLLIVVGLSVHQAIGTSLAVVVFSSIVGTIMYGAGGKVNLTLVMTLLVGSTIGVQIGAYLCQRLHAARLQRYFVVVVLLAAVLVAADLAWRFFAA